jgi:hypothetical protein
MLMIKRCVVCLVNCTALAAFLGGTLVASSAPVTFTLDPAQTSITVSGNVAGGTLQVQGTGGLTTTFTGSLLIDLANNSILVTPGSQIDAVTNGVWQPAAGGKPGSAPADFGGKAQVGSGFFSITAKAALRDLLLDVTSAAMPLTNGQFDASGLLFAFSPSGKSALDYDAVLTSGSQPLSGLATNKVTSQASLVSSGQSQTLTIPINATTSFTLLTPNDSTLTLQGQLVATTGSAPVVEIASVNVQDGKINLQWTNVPGKKFKVEFATQFNQWTTLASGLTDTGPTITWSSPLPGNAGFYRVGMY